MLYRNISISNKSNLKENLDKLQIVAKERTVKTQNIEYDLETLVKKIKRGIIKLNPDYQRNHRWTETESSRLMESLILNIPIPTVYLSQDVDVDEEVDDDISRYSVIDGQQRLTAIYGFMTNTFQLEGLEVLELLNGLYYKDLPPFLIRRLEERTIKCLRIDSTVDPQVKFDIFERLNSGAVQLESQELRNAIYRGRFNDMIKQLAKNSDFRELLGIDLINPDENNKVKKMQDVEYVLRFYSYMGGEGENMKKSFKDFLSEQMDKFNQYDDEKLSEMKRYFEKVMKLIISQLGKDAFAKYKVEDNKLKLQSHFNAAVYDAISIAIADNLMQNENFVITDEMKQKITELFFNPDFINSINGSPNDKSKILSRISIVKGVLQ